MNTNILAVLIQEGSRMASEFLKSRPLANQPTPEDSILKFIEASDLRLQSQLYPPEKPQTVAPAAININIVNEEPKVEIKESKATAIATGCIPCAMGHFGTCSGVLNESVRFAHGKDGLGSPEVIDRVNMCMDELNAMERVDLRPEMTTQLTGWEKELADKALSESRAIRHTLENIQDIQGLEKAAANIQTTRKEIGRKWFQSKLNTLSEDDQKEIGRRVMAKLNEIADDEAEE